MTGAEPPEPDLAARLTLEQKAALLSGLDLWSTKPLPAEGVPAVVVTDGPHGVRLQDADFATVALHRSRPATCFPPAVAVGASWDPAVAEQVGAAIGREARALGVHVVLGPGVNIKRSPLCGRNFEYYSEDPLLTGVLAAAHVRAQQEQGAGASVKHFAANNQETDRMRVSADVDERTLREIYLPAFERVVTEARPATVMAAYNRVNGVPATQNRWLLTDVLRTGWGFEGAVVSDWGAVDDAVAAVAAGLDLEMPGPREASEERIVAAVREGRLDEAALDTAVRRVLALTAWVLEPAGDVDAAAHHALARRLAADCAVLLKNDGGVLPLTGGRIAVVGELARTPRYQGAGSSRITPTRLDTPLDAITEQAAAAGATVGFAPGHVLGGEADPALLEEAAALAGSADVAVVVAGLGEDEDVEGTDRSHLDLSPAQVALIRAVAAAAPRTVVVLAHGGVVSLEGWHDDVDAVLDTFLLGQAGGSAIADLLFGAVSPSGRLAETVPVRLSHTASHVNFPGEQGHVRYGEGVMVGYRWHETVGVPARYPFGHGLSYTTFTGTGLTAEPAGDDAARVAVTVTNTGDRAGAEVVQLYVATTAGPVRRPVRELRAFGKVRLEPGESRHLTFDLDRRAFAYWDVDRSGWVVPGGEYAIQLGRDAATVLDQVTVVLAGDPVSTALTLDHTVAEWLAHPVVGPTLLQELLPDLAGQAADIAAQPELMRMIESVPMSKVIELTGGAVSAAKIDELIARTRG